LNASSITFDGGLVSVISGWKRAINSAAFIVSGSPKLYFEDLSPSENEGTLGLPLLHVESILLPSRAAYALTIQKFQDDAGERERQLIFDWARFVGFAFSVGGIGDYGILFNVSGTTAPLYHDGDPLFVATWLGDSLYSRVSYLIDPTLPPPPTPTAEFIQLNRGRSSLVKCRLFLFSLAF
jgi:hypothetical protein